MLLQMRLTTRTRYALRAMTDLARHSEGKAIPLSEISVRQEIKLKYLEQIFLKLHRAKLIDSKKGPGGGYFISRNPSRIKVIEILTAVGESTAPVFCVDEKQHTNCPRIRGCPTRPYWRRLGETIDSFFASLTLADISQTSEETELEVKSDE